MHANNDPLASDLLIRFREQMRREGFLASASRQTSFRHPAAVKVSALLRADVQS